MSTTAASLEDINSTSSAVVANFFRTTTTKSNTAQTTTPTDTKLVRTKHRTAGVGSRTVVDGTNNSQDTRLKAILRVGQKRKSNDNEDDELESSQLNANDDDDDDDDCRTGIDDTKRQKPDIVPEPTIPSKKKKKKGKKERQQDAVVGTTMSESTQTMPPSVAVMDENLDHGGTTISKTESPEATEEEQRRRRRHRPKVRSRQKNIYKDKRPMDQKPIHLIPGKKEFGGRPLTVETRTKLVDILPPQQPPRQYNDNNRRHNNNNNKNNVNHDDDIKHGEMRSDEGGLAIDDLLADDYDAKLVDKINAVELKSTKNKSKVSKVKRRPKYKNLIA